MVGALLKALSIILIVIVLLFLLSLVGFKIYIKRDEKEKKKAPGNGPEYNLKNIPTLSDSPLKGKRILFLGSSVTKGAASCNVSFVEYLANKHGIVADKKAVNGTTLVDSFSILSFFEEGRGDSYVTRLKEVDTSTHYDAVVVQLSTNDASKGKELGLVSESYEGSDFDTSTITGAIEYIIWYVKTTWNCPIVFYNGSYYKSEAYSKMVTRLSELKDKWNIGVIDLYSDKSFNDISLDTYNLYMFDHIHPTKAGYLLWWIPKFKSSFIETFGN